MSLQRKLIIEAASALLFLFIPEKLLAGSIEKNTVDELAAKVYHCKFDFGAETSRDGWTPVVANTVYNPQTGYGFLAGAEITVGNLDQGDGAERDFCTSNKPFLFSVDVPQEGNYRVTLTLGGKAAAHTFVKAESRRLMLENIETPANSTATRTIIVNVRNSSLPEGQSVKLNDREKGMFHWDNSLTLEFSGKQPSVCAVEIEVVNTFPTVFLAGDSTVTDQTREPWTSWGQMLTRFLKPEIAVANHAESGLRLKSFTDQRRLDKILMHIKAGDYLFIQFGHNDMKRGTPDEVGYQDSLRHFIDEARKRSAYPVLVISMHRRKFDENGKVVDTMQGFPEAMKAVAQEQNVPLIDLHAMSRKLYEAWGPEASARAFVDGTHHNAYGAYELAKCVINGIKDRVPQLAKYVIDDMPAFDPTKPDSIDEFNILASPMQSGVKPEGS